MPGALTSRRLTPALLATIVTAVLSFWICFAVVASVTRTSAGPTAAAHQARRELAGPVATTLALSPVPALRVRSALIQRTPAAPRVGRRKHRMRATATDIAASPEATPATNVPVAVTAPVETTRAEQPAPSPRPVPTPRPAPKPAPKQATAPDFDESQPSGFDTSG
jgi:hypothetical protein